MNGAKPFGTAGNALSGGERLGLCLSIRQPWAWLIVNGHKDVENRTWPTKVRGWIGIHTGKTVDADGWNWVRKTFPNIGLPTSFNVGGIVGRAFVQDCVTELDSPWFFGPHGFVMRYPTPEPFQPCRGQLGFFRATPALPLTKPAPEQEKQ